MKQTLCIDLHTPIHLRWQASLTITPQHIHFRYHDDVIKWKHLPRNWPFVRGIHRSPVNSPHKGQWRGALMFSSICVWINDWVNNREAGDLRRYRRHYDVIVMYSDIPYSWASFMHRASCFVCNDTFLVFHEDTIYRAIFVCSQFTYNWSGWNKTCLSRMGIYPIYFYHDTRDIYCNVLWVTLLITTSLKLPFSNWY